MTRRVGSGSTQVIPCSGDIGTEMVPFSATNPLPVAATAAGATSTSRLASSAATTNATLVKNAAGTVTQISGSNTSGSARYLRLYDKATAPVPASDTARKVYVLPAGSAFVFDCLDTYAAGIGYAITGAAADLDNTAIAAADIICLNVDYR